METSSSSSDCFGNLSVRDLLTLNIMIFVSGTGLHAASLQLELVNLINDR